MSTFGGKGKERSEMKLTQRKNRAEPSLFSGRIKVTIAGLDQLSRIMTKNSGLASKNFIIRETTLDEVYGVVYGAIRQRCEISSKSKEGDKKEES